MSRNDFSKVISSSELKETFTLFLSKQSSIQSYPVEVLPCRAQLVEWMVFLCQNLSFKPETLFRAVSLFDSYLSKAKNIPFNIYELKLSCVACLSLATKLEEINCNFIEFLTDKVLNDETNKMYSTEQLTQREIEVLMALSFNTNQSTPYQFLNIFQQIVVNVFGQNEKSSCILNSSEYFLTCIVKSENAINLSAKDMALLAINQALQMNSCQENYACITWSYIQKLVMEQSEEAEKFEQFNSFARSFTNYQIAQRL